uniref:UDP-N-acetylglucosamine transferase subunit ALG13 n=1 Tax=Evadne anonyx TaxID=141404 RepID=A0A9N6WSF1_9CRUS|nr:EOG090X0KOU [Evadne anonyx]
MEISSKPKSVFVTVGTTSFDELIGFVLEKKFLRMLEEKGYSKVTLQIGHGTEPSIPKSNILVEWYRLKNSISNDILSSSLIISHAGAGSCLEILEKQKPLIVVVNPSLMNNHQVEFASKLHQEGHVHMCNPETLYITLAENNLNTIRSYHTLPCKSSELSNKIIDLMQIGLKDFS